MSIETLRAQLLAEAAQSAERVAGPERLAGVRVEAMRLRDMRRRRGLLAGTAGLAVAAVAATVLVLSGGVPERADMQPAAPTPTPSVEPGAERPPGEVYADVAAALAERGIELAGPMRWGVVDGLPTEAGTAGEGTGPGLNGVAVVPAQGAEITVSTWRVTSPDAGLSARGCGPPSAPEVRCAQEQTPEGQLIRLTSDELGLTGAQFVTGEHVVAVMSHLSGSPSAQGALDPGPLDVDLLAELVQDPRLRR